MTDLHDCSLGSNPGQCYAAMTAYCNIEENKEEEMCECANYCNNNPGLLKWCKPIAAGKCTKLPWASRSGRALAKNFDGSTMDSRRYTPDDPWCDFQNPKDGCFCFDKKTSIVDDNGKEYWQAVTYEHNDANPTKPGVKSFAQDEMCKEAYGIYGEQYEGKAFTASRPLYYECTGTYEEPSLLSRGCWAMKENPTGYYGPQTIAIIEKYHQKEEIHQLVPMTCRMEGCMFKCGFNQEHMRSKLGQEYGGSWWNHIFASWQVSRMNQEGMFGEAYNQCTVCYC